MDSYKRSLRFAIPKVELGTVNYTALEKFPGSQMPTFKEVVERVMYLKSKEMRNSIDSAALMTAKEVQDIYIYNLNIYPVVEKNIKKRVLNDYQEFKKISSYPKGKRSGISYQSSVLSFNKKMETGIDVKTEDRDRQEELIKLYVVKCGDQKEMLYIDNIKIKDCLCKASSVSKCPDFRMKLFAEVPVDKDWLQKEMEKKEELARQAKAKAKSDQEVASMFSKVDSGEVVLEEANVPEEVYVPEEMDGDVFRSPVPLSLFETPSSVTKRLRSAIPSSASSGTSSLSLQSP